MTTSQSLMACQHLTLAADPRDDPEQIESLTAMMRSQCERTAWAEGGVGVADELRTRFWPESDAELAARQARENDAAAEEGREALTLSRLHFAMCDAEIAWPEPTVDGSPTLAAFAWHKLPDGGLVVITTNTADHGAVGWVGKLVWLDGGRYRVTGVPPSPDVDDRPEGKGASIALLVKPEPSEDEVRPAPTDLTRWQRVEDGWQSPTGRVWRHLPEGMLARLETVHGRERNG